MKPSELLKAGRARIEAGWCQHVPEEITDDGWKYCAIGALSPAYEMRPDYQTLQLAWMFLDKATPGKASIVIYNDKWWRRKKQILAVYDRAIAMAERKEKTISFVKTSDSRPQAPGRKTLEQDLLRQHQAG